MAILCHSVVPTPLNSCLMHSYQRMCMQASTSVRLPWCWTNFPFRGTLIAPHYRRRSSYGSKTKQHAGRIRIFAAISNSQSWTSLPYVQINECLVYPPPSRRKKPKAVLQFLGGAFIGAAPEITYSLFIELLAKDGFLVVAVPYNVTFDHAAAVEEIHQKFNTCLDSLLEDGVPSAGISPSALSGLPVISVGHSNGALMQVLIGSICKLGKLPKANVIISFNNKPATDAVPFFDQTGPTLSQISTLLETSPISYFARQLTADGLRVMLEEPLPFPPGASRENLESARKFLRQIPGVVNQHEEPLVVADVV
ncbi:hypothetical protein O6H91_21G010100 [Diphasiastrum complanatum]|uniref:Uncharacterized protein n=1 Tax=Diphasiastrum complanatum TaxID=34168 RepID=A0ACC2AHP6_DIPCM|nr:hypothetical protein O6H91_21G010100 [Diphasiastrum complanatum]